MTPVGRWRKRANLMPSRSSSVPAVSEENAVRFLAYDRHGFGGETTTGSHPILTRFGRSRLITFCMIVLILLWYFALNEETPSQ